MRLQRIIRCSKAVQFVSSVIFTCCKTRWDLINLGPKAQTSNWGCVTLSTLDRKTETVQCRPLVPPPRFIIFVLF